LATGKTNGNSAEGRMEYQRCRAIGHRWENIPVTQPPAFGAAIDLRCENCATVRRDIISRPSGLLISRYYVYPEDYQDTERHDKAWWRSEFIESLHIMAREYLNTDNESAPADRKSIRLAKKEWVEIVRPLAQQGPPNPSPRPATKSTTRQTRRKT
jgi:hypothetical protein